MIEILVADDHPVVRGGMRTLLNNSEIRIVAEAATISEVLGLLRERKFDALLLDMMFPDGNAIDVLPSIKASHPALPILIMTNLVREASAAITAGATGFLSKQAPGEEVRLAIETIVAGGVYVGRGALHPFAEERPSTRAAHRELSRREMEIMTALLEGRRNKEIAHQLGLSEKTISTYRTRLQKKLNAPDLPALMLYAVRHGLADWA